MREFNWLDEQFGFIEDCIDSIPDELPTLTISEFAEQNIIIPAGTPRPGRYSFDYTPYSKKICDSMSPQSSKREVVLVGGVQITKTTIAAVGQVYYMSHCKERQLFASGSEDLIRKFRVDALDLMIESVDGLSESFTSQSDSSKRKGATLNEIEYPGGSWHSASAENPKDFRQVTKKIVWGDEIDAWKRVSGHEGTTKDLLLGRVAGFGEMYKIYAGSTPTTYENSEIWSWYLEGDQQKYFIKCPHCGELQFLEWGTPDTKNGMKWDTDDDGRLISGSVYYSCKSDNCHKPIYNHHKTVFLSEKNGAEWIPTAVPIDPHTESYHLSSLYAPINAITWEQIVVKFLKAKDDPDKLKTFINLYLAEPFKEEGYKPKTEIIEDDERTYKMGEVPKGVLFLTGAVDVQKGEKNSKKNAARLELEILGHGSDRKTYSILYKKFYGSVNNSQSGAWQSLREFFVKTEGVFYRNTDGRPFNVKRVFVDSGYNKDVVYNFCQFSNGFYPIKGLGKNSKIKTYTKRTVSYGFTLYETQTNYYKSMTYRHLEVKRNFEEGVEQFPGFCDFPIEYGKKNNSDVTDYYKQLTSETMLSDGTFDQEAYHGRNEPLDIRGYNLACGDSWLDDRVEEFRIRLKRNGALKEQTEKIDRKFVIQDLERRMGAPLVDRTTKK